MGSVDHLRYIFSHMDGELAADIEEKTPGGLKMYVIYIHFNYN